MFSNCQTQLHDLVFRLLGFGPASAPSFLAIFLHPSFGKEWFTLCHSISDICNFLFNKGLQLRVTKGLRRDIEFFNGVETVSIVATLKSWTETLCIKLETE